jgi:hypothetical protein
MCVCVKGVVVEAVVSEVMTRRKEEDGPPHFLFMSFILNAPLLH